MTIQIETELKEILTEIKSDLKELKKDVSSIKTDIAVIKANQDNFKETLSQVNSSQKAQIWSLITLVS
jgi:hypothetical protein